MGIGHLFKLPKNKEFSYRPRHFDPAMEDLRQRVKESEQKYNTNTETVPGTSIRGKMKEYRMRQKTSKSKMKVIRWIIGMITIVLLILIFYFIVEFMGYFYNHA